MTEKRDAYVQKMKAKLDELNAEIDWLLSRVDQARAESRIEYQKQLSELREKRNGLEDKIGVMQQAGESAWEDLKQGLENSWEILKVSISKAKSEFERGYKEGKEE
jgi:uncharacterized coiled-coil DUF342 family protein